MLTRVAGALVARSPPGLCPSMHPRTQPSAPSASVSSSLSVLCLKPVTRTL